MMPLYSHLSSLSHPRPLLLQEFRNSSFAGLRFPHSATSCLSVKSSSPSADRPVKVSLLSTKPTNIAKGVETIVENPSKKKEADEHGSNKSSLFPSTPPVVERRVPSDKINTLLPNGISLLPSSGHYQVSTFFLGEERKVGVYNSLVAATAANDAVKKTLRSHLLKCSVMNGVCPDFGFNFLRNRDNWTCISTHTGSLGPWLRNGDYIIDVNGQPMYTVCGGPVVSIGFGPGFMVNQQQQTLPLPLESVIKACNATESGHPLKLQIFRPHAAAC